MPDLASAAKKLGKKTLGLDELTVDSKLALNYYPALKAIETITQEKIGEPKK